MTKKLLPFLLLLAGNTFAVATPAKVQRVHCENWLSNSAVFEWANATHYSCLLNNGTQAGNALILVAMWPTAGNAAGLGGGGTLTITDDKSNTWNSVAAPTLGSLAELQAFVALNVLTGTRKITLTFSTNIASSSDAGHWMDVWVLEESNIATASAVDGNNGNTGTGTAVTSGSFTPTTSGDLIIHCGADDNHNGVTWARHATPFVLGDVGTLDESSGCQFEVQAVAAAINPQLDIGTSDPWVSIAFALKASSVSQGSPAPAGYVEQLCVSPINGQFAGHSQAVQCPSDGNLLVIVYNAQANTDMCTSASTPTGCTAFVSDNKGNTYTASAIEVGTGGSGDEEIFYAPNATTGPDLSITLTFNVAAPTVATAYIYSVENAVASPACGAAVGATLGSIATASWSGTASITPCTTNVITFGMTGLQSNNGLTVSPGTFSEPDQNNIPFIWYNGGSLSAQTFSYTANAAPGGDVELLQSFKLTTSGGGSTQVGGFLVGP